MSVLDLSSGNIDSADSSLTRSFRFISQVSGIVVSLIGVFALMGWIFNIVMLKSVLPGYVTMKANAALCFILTGLSLYLTANGDKNNKTRLAADVCAILAAVIGFITLSEYLFGWNLGIDELVFKEPQGAAGTSHLGRMSPMTAFNFLALGVSLLLLDGSWRTRISQYLSLTATLIALTAFLGYAYGVPSLYGVASGTEMAVHTAMAFCILSIGILLARPQYGFMAIVSSDSIGGIIARRLLPAAVIVPAVLGWIRLLGERAGFYEAEFGLSLTVLSSMIIFVALIWWNAASLHGLDIERKQAEEARAKLAAIVDCSDDAITSTTLDGVIVSWNKGAERIYGYSSEEVIGRHISVLVPPDRPDEISELMERIKRGERIEQYETARMRKDGGQFDVSLTASPIINSGKITGFSGILRDITERKRTEHLIRKTNEELERRVRERTADLQRANERLQKLDEMKSNFIALASHELKTPLTAIEGFLTVILKGMAGDFTDQQKEFLGVIKTATERLNRLVDDLLDFSRIESGRASLKREPTNLKDLLKEEVIVFKMQAKSKEIELEELIDDHLDEILCDRDRLKEVLDNLISNAIKYTPRRGRIKVGARNLQGCVQIEVRDTGIGIREEDQEKIFEPFQQLRKSGLDGEKSTGLGLALVKKIIEAQGGKVAVQSHEGEGSTFFVTLPVNK